MAVTGSTGTAAQTGGAAQPSPRGTGLRAGASPAGKERPQPQLGLPRAPHEPGAPQPPGLPRRPVLRGPHGPAPGPRPAVPAAPAREEPSLPAAELGRPRGPAWVAPGEASRCAAGRHEVGPEHRCRTGGAAAPAEPGSAMARPARARCGPRRGGESAGGVPLHRRHCRGWAEFSSRAPSKPQPKWKSIIPYSPLVPGAKQAPFGACHLKPQNTHQRWLFLF